MFSGVCTSIYYRLSKKLQPFPFAALYVLLTTCFTSGMAHTQHTGRDMDHVKSATAFDQLSMWPLVPSNVTSMGKLAGDYVCATLKKSHHVASLGC